MTPASTSGAGEAAEKPSAQPPSRCFSRNTPDDSNRSAVFPDTAVDDSIAMRGFSASLPMALLRAREAAMRLFRPLLAEHDLTEQQWRVLRALSASALPLEVGQIVDATFLLAPSLSRILKGLETRSLVERSAVATDQRRAEISLTAEGRDLVANVAPASEAIYNQIEESFGADELDRLLSQLATLRDTTHQIGALHD